MQVFEIEIIGVTPYSQSKFYEVEKLQGEGNDDYAQRTWRNYMHVTSGGEVFIPPNAFKNCVSSAAQYMKIGIPGQGKSTYTKNFEAGLQCAKPILTGIKAADVKCEKLFLPSDGKRGSGKRIWKYYPTMPTWGGVVEVMVLDETILQTSKRTGASVMEDVIRGAGQFIGLGRFRPRQNGYYGRFDVKRITEIQMRLAA